MRRRRNTTRFVLLLVFVPFLWPANGSSESINTQKSSITVHVFKTGVFSVFGHNHEINAPIQQGTVSQQNKSVQFVVDAGNMQVMDKDVSDSDRAQIHKTMLGPEVLDVEKYPEIIFRSTEAEQLGPDKWSVQGHLTIRGNTRPVTVTVTAREGHYRGGTEIKQKDFGIIPVSAGGGTVKTKNEMRVDFDISTD